MEEQNRWIPYKEIDWDCPNNNRFNVDTRDFHCGYFFDENEHKDMKTISRYSRFFCTKDEVIEIIDRLFAGSGGECEWRFVTLKTSDKRFNDWSLKYLRIYRTDKGFIICDMNHKAISKNVLLCCEIDKELLNAH